MEPCGLALPQVHQSDRPTKTNLIRQMACPLHKSLHMFSCAHRSGHRHCNTSCPLWATSRHRKVTLGMKNKRL